MKRQKSGLSHLDPNVKILDRNLLKQHDAVCPDQENHIIKKIKLAHSRRNLNEVDVSTTTNKTNLPTNTNFLADQWILSSDIQEDVFQAEISLQHRSKLSPKFGTGTKISASHREIAIEWLVEMQAYLKVGNEVLHLAVTLLDFVLDKEMVEESKLQLLAAASIWLSHKFYFGGIKAKCILKWCDSITLEELAACERKILLTTEMSLLFTNTVTLLNIRLHDSFGCDIPIPEYHACNYLLEVMLLNIDFVQETVSSRTLAVVYTTLHLFKSKKKVQFRDQDDPRRCQLLHIRLLSILRTIRDNPMFRKKSALYKKYSSARYSWVSANLNAFPE